MKFKNITLIISLFVTLICCNKQRVGKNQEQLTDSILISAPVPTMNEDICFDLKEIENYEIRGDTLYILSGDEFLYYPFGIYKDINQIASAFPLDGNLLISNDIYKGTTVVNGKLVLSDWPGIGIKEN